MSKALLIRAVGLPWYEAETFEEVMALMKDGDRLFRTYAEWEVAAQRTEERLSGEGNLVVRAHIRPVEFAEWCRARGHDVDAQGRLAFANWTAKQAHGNTQ